MKKIKNNYTNFILTMIAVALFGLNYNLIFKGNIISDANAAAITKSQVWYTVDHWCQAFGNDIRCGRAYEN